MYRKDDIEKAMLGAYHLGFFKEDFAELSGLSLKRVKKLYKEYSANSENLEGSENLSREEICDILRVHKVLLACYESGLNCDEVQEFISWKPTEVSQIWKSLFEKTESKKTREKYINMGVNPRLVLAAYHIIDNVEISEFYKDEIKLGADSVVLLWEIYGLYKDGLSYNEMGNQLNCINYYISYICKLFDMMGLKQDRNDNRYIQATYKKLEEMTGLTQDKVEVLFEDLKECYLNGVISYIAASKFGIDEDVALFCYKRFRHLGLVEEKKSRKKLTEKEYDSIKQLYEQNYTLLRAVEETKLSRAVVNRVFQELSKTDSLDKREQYKLGEFFKTYDLRLRGVKIEEIARMQGISTSQVADRLSYIRTHVDGETLNKYASERSVKKKK